MPTYEYKCSKCEEIFERFQRISDEPLKVCPVCGGSLNRLVSGGVGIIFKGSGFYTTDYKNSGSYSRNSDSKSSDKEPDSGTSKDKEKDTSSSASSKDSSSTKKEEVKSDQKPKKK